jgi:hypothetical protein
MTIIRALVGVFLTLALAPAVSLSQTRSAVIVP